MLRLECHAIVQAVAVDREIARLPNRIHDYVEAESGAVETVAASVRSAPGFVAHARANTATILEPAEGSLATGRPRDAGQESRALMATGQCLSRQAAAGERNSGGKIADPTAL